MRTYLLVFAVVALFMTTLPAVCLANGVSGPCEPETQGYWHRQCLAISQLNGGIDPGREGRGPTKFLEPDFEDLLPCVGEGLAIFLIPEYPCDAMDAHPDDEWPANDPCEKAHKQFAALLFNFCSFRLACIEESAALDFLEMVAELIYNGDCKTAATLASSVNEGLLIPTANGP
jgi:hypothetical protein